MTVKEILNVIKNNNLSTRAELAESAGVSERGLYKMEKRNDMKLSTFFKLIENEGYTLILTDGEEKIEL